MTEKTPWKQKLKLLKSKDITKKTEGLEYCRQDVLFLLKGGAFSYFILLMAKPKVSFDLHWRSPRTYKLIFSQEQRIAKYRVGCFTRIDA